MPGDKPIPTIRHYLKGKSERISEHFNSKEFDCPCVDPKCKWTLIDELLMLRLEKMRERLGCPLIISRGGGFRCEGYQQELRERGYETSKGPSTHSGGMAVDLQTGKHSGADLEKVARECGFQAVGVAKTWIHCDTRSGATRRWVYK